MKLTCKFDQSLVDLISRNLEQHDVAELSHRDRRHAAVAFTLVDCSEPAQLANIPFSAAAREQAAYILTTRAVTLSSHAGQRAFPGGRVDPGETVEQAALRELEEEVGIRPANASPYMRVYYRYPDCNILLDTWVVDEYQGVVEPLEGQALLWIDASQARLYRFPAADVPVIEAIKNSEKAKTRCLP